jgi:hypothetical protein
MRFFPIKLPEKYYESRKWEANRLQIRFRAGLNTKNLKITLRLNDDIDDGDYIDINNDIDSNDDIDIN